MDMDWTERINGALAYVEHHLDEEIDLERMARIAGCSVYNFQRLFSFVADKPLSQYIRERRLTLAAFDVVRTEERLIDIALRYGYESQDAFARAFRAYHGVLPSAARSGPVTLRSCPRLIFRSETKEDTGMNYRVEEWPAFTVAGFRTQMRTDEVFARVPGLWKDAWGDGRIKALHALFMQADYRPEGYLGVAAGGRWSEEGMVDYYMGVTTWVDVPEVARVQTPQGMEQLDMPAATWVILEANGEPGVAMQQAYKAFYGEWLPQSGYVLADVPVLESYMTEGRQNIWIAVEKAGE